MRTRRLGRTDLVVSELGFGAAPLGRSDDVDAGVAAVHAALDRGITFFDVAPFYGATRAETVLGRALRGIARDRYVLSTKVGRYADDVFDFSARNVRASVHASMARLGVDYLDVVLCHDIEYVTTEQIASEALPELRALQREGVVRAVGASALPLAALDELLARCELDVVLSYSHYNLFDTTASSFDPRGAGLVLASALGNGLLTDRGPPPWNPAPRELRDACARLATTCRERNVDLARAALRFALAHPTAAATLVGMRSRDEVIRNTEAVVDRVDLELIAALRTQLAAVLDTTWPSGRWPAR